MSLLAYDSGAPARLERTAALARVARLAGAGDDPEALLEESFGVKTYRATTVGFVPVGEASIRQALQNLMQDRTTFIIAHRIQSVMDADLILVLDKGRIIQCGTHAELMEQAGVYQQIYDIQTRVEAELEEEIGRAEYV